MQRRGQRWLLVGLPLVAGCDPLLDVEGAFFPSWMLCLAGGILIAVGMRPLLARLGVEPYLGPLPLIYSCLALSASFATWLLFFRT
jgi:hypothetical protein